MHSKDMGPNGIASSEQFATKRTRERLLTGVDAEVSGQPVLLGKQRPTRITLEGLFTGMSTAMPGQVQRLGEQFVAPIMVAHVDLFRGVLLVGSLQRRGAVLLVFVDQKFLVGRERRLTPGLVTVEDAERQKFFGGIFGLARHLQVAMYRHSVHDKVVVLSV